MLKISSDATPITVQKLLNESLETEHVTFKLTTHSIVRFNPQTMLHCLTSESK